MSEIRFTPLETKDCQLAISASIETVAHNAWQLGHQAGLLQGRESLDKFAVQCQDDFNKVKEERNINLKRVEELQDTINAMDIRLLNLISENNALKKENAQLKRSKRSR